VKVKGSAVREGALAYAARPLTAGMREKPLL
jgi:hypothetical protein